MIPALRSITVLLSFLAVAAALQADSRAPAAILGSTVFRFEDLKVQHTTVGERRDVARQPTATLDEFECHLGVLNAGQTSHLPHRHPQEELIILTAGSLDVFINGTTRRIGPGSLFFFASYDLHNVRSVGTVPARYGVFNFSTPITHQIPAVAAAESASPEKLRSQVFDWNTLVAKPTATGWQRPVFDAPTVTCARLECHVTTLQPGAMPHRAHRHPEEEVIFVRDGALEVTIDGQSQHAGPGSVVFFGSNDEHAMKNIGPTAATYYVMLVGTAKTPKASTL